VTSASASDAAYRELASTLNPVAVSQYLAATRPWQLESRRGNDIEFWSLLGDDGTSRGRILLPLASDFTDFLLRFSETLRAIGVVNGWSPVEVEQHVVSVHADMLLIRLDQLSADGTISLKQADATLDAIYQMLKHAAITAAQPGRVQRGGRLPGVVSSFLDDCLRLGHTKRGSFVFTVVSRLDDPPADAPAQVDDGLVSAGFARRAMATLARGLETTRDLARGDHAAALEDPARWGLSAGLLESLEAIAAPDTLQSLTLEFEWASAQPAPDAGRVPIHLEHAAVAALGRVHELLLREEEPTHRETLYGQVVSLARDGDSDLAGEAGSAVLSAEVNGRKRNVHMTLSGSGHRQAIRAYELRKPLIVTGDLVFERRAWRLTGDIQVDASLLDRDSR
jgi:hypothetical protein